MLGVMRKYKQSIVIKIVFGVIVLSFIGTMFLVWGRGEEGLGGSAFAAKVNGDKIPIEEYQKTYYRLKSVYEQIYGRTLTPDLEKQMGIKKLALDNLVETALIRQEAKRMGIKVSKEEVADAISAISAFQKDGAFNFQQYQQLLKANRLTPKDFEEAQKEELLVKKARQKIMDKATVGDEEALQAFKKQNDKVDLLFASFSPAEVRGEVKLSEQDLNGYLQSHQEEFKTPEQISLLYIVIDPAKVATKLAVSDEEAQTFYQKNIDRYQGKGGILPFNEVKELVKADALKAKGAKQAYEMAADTLNKNLKSADINAAAKSLGVTVAETPLFTAAAPAAQLASETEVVKKAFLLKAGELGGPVETARGVYLLKLKEKKPAAVPPLEKIRAQVEVRAKEDKARELAKKKAEETLAQLTKGGANVALQETGNFAFSDKSPDIPKIGKSSDLMEAAFALTTASPAAKTPFKVGDRWYVVKLKNRIAADTAEFQRTKEQIKKSLLPKKQQDAMDSWLKELKSKAKIETNAALLAE
ncbi:MAG: hypothetical protein FD174_4291 [Geobacteraceae bacterium]|nr:MAG: hypothetical protein FD174_4291 [Geobacteraceae bacterium]